MTKKIKLYGKKNYLDYPIDLRLLTAGVEHMNLIEQ